MRSRFQFKKIDRVTKMQMPSKFGKQNRCLCQRYSILWHLFIIVKFNCKTTVPIFTYTNPVPQISNLISISKYDSSEAKHIHKAYEHIHSYVSLVIFVHTRTSRVGMFTEEKGRVLP